MDPMSTIDGSSSKKRKGRGKAKGVSRSNGMTVEIHQGCIISPKPLRLIGVLFKQRIKGPWITFSEYPKTELNTLFARWKEANFSYTCTEEQLRAAFDLQVENSYANWMFELRNDIFTRFKDQPGEIYVNNPENVPSTIWRQMVIKWMDEKWKAKSIRNRQNRDSSTVVSTTGSVKMAKLRKEMLQETGIEPDPIDCFRRFHIRKDDESFFTEKTKDIYEKMECKRQKAIDKGSEVNSWKAYREAIGPPKHGRVLGMGVGIKPKDVFGSSSKGNNHHAQTEREAQMESRMSTLEEVVKQLSEQIQHLKVQMQRVSKSHQIDVH